MYRSKYKKTIKPKKPDYLWPWVKYFNINKYVQNLFLKNYMGKPIRIKWLRGPRRHKKNVKKLVYAVQALVVVYFDQQMGALHAVRWLKSCFWQKQVFQYFLIAKGKKERILIGKCKNNTILL